MVYVHVLCVLTFNVFPIRAPPPFEDKVSHLSLELPDLARAFQGILLYLPPWHGGHRHTPHTRHFTRVLGMRSQVLTLAVAWGWHAALSGLRLRWLVEGKLLPPTSAPQKHSWPQTWQILRPATNTSWLFPLKPKTLDPSVLPHKLILPSNYPTYNVPPLLFNVPPGFNGGQFSGIYATFLKGSFLSDRKTFVKFYQGTGDWSNFPTRISYF